MVSFHTILPSEGTSLNSYLGSALRNTKGKVCESCLHQKYLSIFLKLRWEISLAAAMGSPQGRKTLWGEEGRTAAERTARSVAEGLPDCSGGCARRAVGGQRRCLWKLQAFCKRLDRKLLRFYC